MIITRLQGGLGNQMFQYAAGRAISAKHHQELKLDISGYGQVVYNIKGHQDAPRSYRLRFFQIQAGVATPEEIASAKYRFGPLSKGWRLFRHKVLRKFYVDYHPDVIEKGYVDAFHPSYVEGFFQSEKNFSDISSQIRNELSLKPEHVSPAMATTIQEMRFARNAVSLHVRRGDYVTNASVNSAHGTCSPEYYAEAIAYIKNHAADPHFFVFSDDIKWVKQNLPIEGGVTYVSNPDLQDYEEISLMSHCKHNIVANSSFSWWGAWLNPDLGDKIVIAPKRWMANDDSHPNIIPDGWVRL